MQPVVASLQLALLFAVQVHGGVFAPSLPYYSSAKHSGKGSIVMKEVTMQLKKVADAKNAKTSNAQDSSCEDDPTWVDEDGDGCAAYASAIGEGLLKREVACGFEPHGATLESGDPHGASIHCRATCGTCAQPEEPQIEPPPILMEMFKAFLAAGSQDGQAIPSSVEDSEVAESQDASCKDDPAWVDVDGDGCAAYADAIASGGISQEVACGRESAVAEDGIAAMDSGNPHEAGIYCPVTCGNCPLRAFEDNDADMKDMIRLLVEQESENILSSASVAESEEEDVPEATTTTTTVEAHKCLPEVSTNSTCVLYSAPEDEDGSMDVPQQSFKYQVNKF